MNIEEVSEQLFLTIRGMAESTKSNTQNYICDYVYLNTDRENKRWLELTFGPYTFCYRVTDEKLSFYDDWFRVIPENDDIPAFDLELLLEMREMSGKLLTQVHRYEKTLKEGI